MDYKNRSIIISAIIIALGILFSNGVYKYDTPKMGVVQRYNIFTGTIELCIKGQECKLFFDAEANKIGESIKATKSRRLSQEEMKKLYDEGMEEEARKGSTKE